MAFENLEARLRLDSEQFSRSSREAAESMEGLADRAASVGSRMQGIGTRMSLGITAPLAAMGAMSIRAASDVEELQGKSSVVFGDMVDDVRQWSEETADAMGRSRFALEETVTSFADLFVPMGATREEAADMAQTMTVLTEDLASFNNMPSAQVQENLFAAMTGSSEAVKKYGVDVSQARVEQELLNMGIEGGADAATRMQEAQARLNIIMRETSDAQGDAVRTSDSFANQMKNMRAQLNEVAVQFGNELLPAATSLVGVISDLSNRFSGLSDSQRRLIVIAAGVAAAIGPLLLVFGTLLTMVPTIVAGAGAIGTALTLMTGPIGLVVLAIAALVAAFATDFMGIRSVTEDAVGGILNNIQPLLDLLGPEFKETVKVWRGLVGDAIRFVERLWRTHGEVVMSIIRPIFDSIALVIEGALDAIITTVRVALALLRGDWSGAFDMIADFMNRQVGRYRDIGRNLVMALVNGVRAYVGVLVAVWSEPIDASAGWLWDQYGRFMDIGSGLLTGMADGLVGAKGKLTDGISNSFGAVTGYLWNQFGTFWDTGYNLLETMSRGLLAGGTFLYDKARAVVSRMLDVFAAIGSLYQTGVDYARSLGDGIRSSAGYVVDKAGLLIGELIDRFWNAVGAFWNIGNRAIEILSDGLQAGRSYVTDGASNVMSGATSYLWNKVGDFWDIGSDAIDILGDGIRRGGGIVTDVSRVISDGFDHVWGRVGDTWDMGSTMVRILGDGVSGNKWRARVAFGDVIGEAADYVWGQVGNFYDMGRGMVRSLGRGIEDNAWRVINEVRSMVRRARDLLPGSDAKRGPLSDLTDSGRAIPGTMSIGVEENKDALSTSTEQMAEAASVQPTASSMSESSGLTASDIQQALSGMQIKVSTGDSSLDQLIAEEARVVFTDELADVKARLNRLGNRGGIE